jgi:pimeloyl-ACP methyl ester carboxylesterase
MAHNFSTTTQHCYIYLTMNFMHSQNNIRIRYSDTGNQSKIPLILCHGLTATLEMWGNQVHFFESQYRVITWDNRGHGSSSAPNDIDEYSTELFANDLLNLIQTLNIQEKIILGGMSFGGHTALQFAYQFPELVKALILSDTTTNTMAINPSMPSEIYSVDPGITGCYSAMRRRPDLTLHLKNLAIPTLIIAGTKDSMILPNLGNLTDNLPQRKLALMKSCSHGTSSQRPTTWNQLVATFLEDLDNFENSEQII